MIKLKVIKFNLAPILNIGALIIPILQMSKRGTKSFIKTTAL